MSDTGQGQPEPTTSTESPLTRRTFLSRLGLAASFGLAGLAACGGGGGGQGAQARGDRPAGTDTPEENGGEVAQQGGGQEGEGQEGEGQEGEGQEEQAAGAGGGTLGLGIIGIIVTDLGASLDFYRRLGLNIPADVDLGAQAYRLRLDTGQIFWWETIGYTQRYFPNYEPGAGQRKVSLEFGFRNAGEVDAMYDALLAEGYESWKPPLSWGPIRFAGVVDPDDNQISLRYPRAS